MSIEDPHSHRPHPEDLVIVKQLLVLLQLLLEVVEVLDAPVREVGGHIVPHTTYSGIVLVHSCSRQPLKHVQEVLPLPH
jgi:hypothetical protein